MEKLICLVKDRMNGLDGSHDWSHVERVVNLARDICDHWAGPEKFDRELVEISALAHDIMDHKYFSGDEELLSHHLRTLLGWPEDRIDKVKRVIEGVSYTKEMKGYQIQPDVQAETYIVQDADRLDAMGAIGIGRAFAFGAGKQGGSLQSVIQHMEDKLVNLQNLLKTRRGKQIGERRHQFLIEFLEQFERENGNQ